MCVKDGERESLETCGDILMYKSWFRPPQVQVSLFLQLWRRALIRGEVRNYICLYLCVNPPFPLPLFIFIFQVFSSPVPKILLLSGHHGK